MYDPSVGRFTGTDVLGFAAGDANLFRYVANSPTNATDPSGMTLYIPDTKADRDWWTNRFVGEPVSFVAVPGGGQFLKVVVGGHARQDGGVFHNALYRELGDTRMPRDHIVQVVNSLFEGGIAKPNVKWDHEVDDRVFTIDPWPQMLSLGEAGVIDPHQKLLTERVKQHHDLKTGIVGNFPFPVEVVNPLLATARRTELESALRATPKPLTGARFELKLTQDYYKFDSKAVGIKLDIIFHPDPKIEAKSIRLVQTIRSVQSDGIINSRWTHPDELGRNRLRKIETTTGLHVDCLFDYAKKIEVDNRGNPTTSPPYYDLFLAKNGSPYYGDYAPEYERSIGWSRGGKTNPATITDKPAYYDGTRDFETVAVNTDTGEILGSVRWGFRVEHPDPKGAAVIRLLPVVSSRYPTRDFYAAYDNFRDHFFKVIANGIIDPDYVGLSRTELQNKLVNYARNPVLHDNLSKIIDDLLLNDGKP